jgi:hypothetical protein
MEHFPCPCTVIVVDEVVVLTRRDQECVRIEQMCLKSNVTADNKKNENTFPYIHHSLKEGLP